MPDDREDALAARSGCGFVPLGLGCLRLTGSDAARFLHGQCTQEVKSRREHEGGYAFLLDARGRNLGDFRFVVSADGIRCFLARGRIPPFSAWLDRFVIAADVRLTDVSADFAPVLVTGPAAARTLGGLVDGPLPRGEDRSAICRFRGEEVLVVGDGVSGSEGFDVWLPAAPARHPLAGELAARGARPLGPGAFDALRIEAGRPMWGVDLDETVLPEETGQGERAVSYTKGCYSGQEVVAKQKHLGKPRKMLTGFLLERAAAVPAPILDAAGAEIGRLTSCAVSTTLGRPIGLGILKWPPPAAGQHLSARDASGPLRLEVAQLPFVSPSS